MKNIDELKCGLNKAIDERIAFIKSELSKFDIIDNIGNDFNELEQLLVIHISNSKVTLLSEKLKKHINDYNKQINKRVFEELMLPIIQYEATRNALLKDQKKFPGWQTQFKSLIYEEY